MGKSRAVSVLILLLTTAALLSGRAAAQDRRNQATLTVENTVTLGLPAPIDEEPPASKAQAAKREATTLFPAQPVAYETRRPDDSLPPPDDLPTPRFTAREERPKPFIFDVLFFGRSGMDAPSTNVKMSEIGLTYQHRQTFNERLLLTYRPFFDVLFLSGPGGPEPILPSQLYKVAVDVQADYQFNDRFGLSAGVTPGFWTDWVKTTGSDFRLPARLMGTYRISDRHFVAAGILYTDNIRRNLLPAFGMIWDINDRFRLEAMYPRSRLVYTLQEAWQIYGVFERGGDTYNIRTYNYDENFEYRDNRFLLGTQVDVWDRASIFFETGVSFYRKFRFDIQPDRDINPAFFMRLGTRF